MIKHTPNTFGKQSSSLQSSSPTLLSVAILLSAGALTLGLSACTNQGSANKADNGEETTTPFRGREDRSPGPGRSQPFRRGSHPLSPSPGGDGNNNSENLIQVYLFKSAAQTAALRFPEGNGQPSAPSDSGGGTIPPLPGSLFQVVNAPQDEIPASDRKMEDLISTCLPEKGKEKEQEKDKSKIKNRIRNGSDLSKLGETQIGPFGTQQLILSAHKVFLCGEWDFRNSPYSSLTVVADEIVLDQFSLHLPLKNKLPSMDMAIFRTESLILSGENKIDWTMPTHFSDTPNNGEVVFHPPLLYFSVSKEVIKKSETSILNFQYSL